MRLVENWVVFWIRLCFILSILFSRVFQKVPWKLLETKISCSMEKIQKRIINFSWNNYSQSSRYIKSMNLSHRFFVLLKLCLKLFGSWKTKEEGCDEIIGYHAWPGLYHRYYRGILTILNSFFMCM